MLRSFILLFKLSAEMRSCGSLAFSCQETSERVEWTISLQVV